MFLSVGRHEGFPGEFGDCDLRVPGHRSTGLYHFFLRVMCNHRPALGSRVLCLVLVAGGYWRMPLDNRLYDFDY
jgi:hypothetical protein